MIYERKNFFLSTDSYKHEHANMLPPGTQQIQAYIEARVGREFEKIRFFGLQGYLKRYLVTSELEFLDPHYRDPGFQEAVAILQTHGTPLNRMMARVAFEVGHVPVRISALPEGVVVPAGIPQVKVESTDSRFAAMATWIETQILRGVWYPSSVCTNSYGMLGQIKEHSLVTGADPNFLPFALHDFGARGATSGESAAIGGSAHLVNSMGTDTDEALEYCANYYNEPCAGFSILATEHSVTTIWGRAREREFYEMICNRYGRAGRMISVVIDSYDQEAAIDLFCNELRPLVNETFGQNGGKLVLRPDSGDPVDNVSRYIIKLGTAYGWDLSSKYLKLPAHIGLIQGDGIDREGLGAILQEMTDHGLRTDNAAFGSGGGLLQKVNRDTGGYAMKACQATVDGQTFPVQKTPKSDPGKASKGGDLAVVINDNGDYESILVEDLRGRPNELRPVFENGVLLLDESLSDIRARA